MTIEVIPYSEASAQEWDRLCTASVNGTLLHTRRFLSYHGERFQDASVILHDAGRIVAVLPAAIRREQPEAVVSHPGATYGGIVHDGWLAGARMCEALAAVAEHFRRQGFRSLAYRPVPYIYATSPAQDDLYALARLGAVRERCDLSCSIDLVCRRAVTERRRRGLKRASKAASISDDAGLIPAFWAVLEDNLARKYGATAVHSVDEIRLLQARFPSTIRLCCALVEGRVEAGIVMFNSANVWHAQYIASSERGYELSLLDAVFEAAITQAARSGARYFDFGTSNEANGTVLNDGLYRFKHEFGGGGVAYEFYRLELSE
ncbi:acetyltransferase (GNAT) family protein [Trinickia symbiotica]|uniref:GNAT family N-acetyltransferase n=1 Tax=Trinickia symbiotica TaxID=863227 RepID=A0A2N7X6X1_9BURK|nr:GNAT family N-acetyltransferase [Trinickia symbiotica]PMS37508.1 GNAT family N-acetyltransferase [Trinickia symbiotica]PPK44088.1 acetyltransferase (GNAT) family protein [Trinickia symbiotica]